MARTEIFDKHVEAYEKWYEEFPEVYQSEILALREQLLTLPENIKGIEVGLGTGRFAQPLGIKEGIEPSAAMGEKALKRGIEIMGGVAEHLPYGDMQFDFVLFVTICHLKNTKDALAEAHRVLKNKGAIIIGFLDRDRPIAQEYIARKHRSIFYANARFYTVDQIKSLLQEAGFKNPEFSQTLFGALGDIHEIQRPKPHYGEGSFVVVKATKK